MLTPTAPLDGPTLAFGKQSSIADELLPYLIQIIVFNQAHLRHAMELQVLFHFPGCLCNRTLRELGKLFLQLLDNGFEGIFPSVIYGARCLQLFCLSQM